MTRYPEALHTAFAGLSLALVGGLTLACASPDYAIYAANEPRLALEDFFSGPTTAVGTLSDRSGNVIRRFRAKGDGSWSEEEQALTVAETWYWDDGEVEPRLWRWEKLPNGRWRGFEDDLTSPATGQTSGNIAHWTYSMRVDTNAYGRVRISANDVMHLVDSDSIINLVDMYFFGIYVGQVVLHIERGDSRTIEAWPADAASTSTQPAP